MGRARVFVYIEAVRLVIDYICGCAERLEYRFCDIPRCAVGTVEPDALAAEGVHSQGNKIADIAVATRGIVHRFADMLAHGIGELGKFFAEGFELAVEVGFDKRYRALVHFFAVGIEKLYAVIVIRIVACGNHNSAVEFVHPRYIRHRRGCGDVEHICVRTRGGKTRNQGVFEHVAGTSCILAD